MPSLAPYQFDSHILAAGFINDYAIFATSSGQVHIFKDKILNIASNDGIASFAFAQDKATLLTGGEDGRICQIDENGNVFERAKHAQKWITSLKAGKDGVFGFGFSKKAVAFHDNTFTEFDHERSVEDIAFAPKGLRIAVARYNGVTLHFVGTKVEPTYLNWNGAHFAVTFSPDNRYVVSSMQENALHGWRLSDGQDLRMSGYPTKVKSWSWSVKGRWLATSGAMAAIVWPFFAKDGPMGKAPLELGTRSDALVTHVACHPLEEMVAIGYDDGMILFVRFSDAKEVLLRRPGKGAISALEWDSLGNRLAFGATSGEAGLIDITA